MTSLLDETKLNLSAVADMFPGTRGADRVSPITVFRWATRGTRTPDGRIVRLESFRIGNRLMTTAEALARYIAALSHQFADDGVSDPMRTLCEGTRGLVIFFASNPAACAPTPSPLMLKTLDRVAR